jgi:hypothetical protein
MKPSYRVTENFCSFLMKDDNQLKDVKNQIGKVQDQMKQNIELAVQRQENVDGIASKSSKLQASASQFSQVATRIRQDQMMQVYKFYTMLALGLICVGLTFTFWTSPGKLLISLGIVAAVSIFSWFYFKRWKQQTGEIAESIGASSSKPDEETGRE